METTVISPTCTLIFLIIAIISTIFYSFFALKIHLVPLIEDNVPWIIHQRWFNLLGSIVGWILLWLLLPNLIYCFVHQSLNTVTIKEILLGLIALLGITGHLPMTLFGIARSSNELAKKLASNN